MILKVKNLIWDEFNSNHLAKHSVTIEEVEQVCHKIVTAYIAHSQRFMIIGKTKKNRTLTIILAQKQKSTFYVVSARDTSRKERGWIRSDQN